MADKHVEDELLHKLEDLVHEAEHLKEHMKEVEKDMEEKTNIPKSMHIRGDLDGGPHLPGLG